MVLFNPVAYICCLPFCDKDMVHIFFLEKTRASQAVAQQGSKLHHGAYPAYLNKSLVDGSPLVIQAKQLVQGQLEFNAALGVWR
jgi:hypothetical protein